MGALYQQQRHDHRGSDLFHVRPATGTGINQKRLDAAFYVFSEAELSETTQLSDGGPYRCYVDSAANKFQADPAFRGDIARIVMYMWLHYSLIGDVNNDGIVDVMDSILIQRYTTDKVELTDEQLYVADVNDDGQVDVIDAMQIQKYSVEKITEFDKKGIS